MYKQDDKHSQEPDQKLELKHWQAIKNRDSSFDGQFYYGVATTRIFCRPGCTSRRPLKKNIRIFSNTEVAIERGYRACKRCKPLADASADGNLRKLLQVCRYVDEHSEGALTAVDLAKRVGLTQYQLHRLFKKFLSVTPKNYIDQSRLNVLKKRLRSSGSVTDAIYDTGIESSSVIYGRLDTHLGMTPKNYREGGKGVDISFAMAATELGHIIIGATDKGLCHLQFGESGHELLENLANEYPNAEIEPMQTERHEHLVPWMEALDQYLSGSDTSKRNAFKAIPLDVQGTAFQKKVWDFLREIPYGQVMSYAEVAKAIGSPKAFRAVANACAGNHVGVVIPCHRVIRGDGSMGGYRWGISRKRTLIDLERQNRGAKNLETGQKGQNND